MANRMKDDDKNEKIIRGLLKLPANRRCINCNNLGPQYVCTNFWTFICTNCSGMHREFTHRVKSISMAKFTSQEVISLQACGNSRAKDIYFKEWDPQWHSYPDSSDIDSLREFIRHVYVDRKYTGEKGTNRSSRMKGHSQDFSENKMSKLCRSSSRSPPYVVKHRDGYKLRCNSDKRSPGYFEIVDERHRDRRNGNVNQKSKLDRQEISDVVSKGRWKVTGQTKG
ncbi:probable ADP-ribosylation factor GTPase-activating protein AGD14 [Dioscorea cayenensis subsp. rotundata]|uniref:Probable ADP-ribosylation factor GTPase-activating protein AGD14 n=1 Tax=Dioscorea cayennensis subsp. rotundata TaxID=55577 RepID=A0AB40BGY8_DIOCR|nr:probable ADP-ribosylation factor GTPase-activating protein AGD14 [Dioscorea cayenensis subsp. rotundata]